MTIALTAPTSPIAAPLSRRRALGLRARLARPARRARRGARARDRAAPRRCARAAGAHSRRPRRRGGRGRKLPRSDRACADAGPATRSPTCRRRRRGWPTPSRAAKRSPSSATTTSTVRRRRRCSGATCAIAGFAPSSTSPIACSKATGRTRRRSARSPRKARRCSSPSIAAPPATSRSLEARQLGLDVIVIDHHQADEQLPAGARRGQSQPARRSLDARPPRRRRPRVHDRGRGQPRAARARILDAGAAASPISSACSTWSRSARLPTWCRSRASTAPSSPRGCWRCVGATIPGSPP